MIAHLVTTGLGPVYDGIAHLLMSPGDLVAALGLALFAGLRGRAEGRWALFALPAAWAIGGLLGLFLPARPETPVGAFSFVVLGVLVAADLALPRALLAALTLALGIAHGVLNGAAIREPLGILGIALALFMLVPIASAFVVSIRRPWARVAIRVAGSWVAASGLLWVGWWLR